MRIAIVACVIFNLVLVHALLPDDPPRCRTTIKNAATMAAGRKRSFSPLQDSDGITRTYGECADAAGYECPVCCDGICCELVEGPMFPANTTLWVPVRFLSLGDDVSRELLDKQLGLLNVAFQPLQIFFVFDSYERHELFADTCNSDPCFTDPSCDLFTKTLPLISETPQLTMNMLLCNTPYLGEAQFPWQFPETDTTHYVEVAHYALVGQSPGKYYEQGMTMVHEVGHYFGLLHTFERDEVCDTVGDYVSDTPAQFTSTHTSAPCTYRPDSCPDLAGKEDVTNYMDYSKDICLQTFTDGQIQRVHQITRRYRPTLYKSNLINASCPTTVGATVMDCTCNDPSRDIATFCLKPRTDVTSASPTDTPAPNTTAAPVTVEVNETTAPATTTNTSDTSNTTGTTPTNVTNVTTAATTVENTTTLPTATNTTTAPAATRVDHCNEQGYCNLRGDCSTVDDEKICSCYGAFTGVRCQLCRQPGTYGATCSKSAAVDPSFPPSQLRLNSIDVFDSPVLEQDGTGSTGLQQSVLEFRLSTTTSVQWRMAKPAQLRFESSYGQQNRRSYAARELTVKSAESEGIWEACHGPCCTVNDVEDNGNAMFINVSFCLVNTPMAVVPISSATDRPLPVDAAATTSGVSVMVLLCSMACVLLAAAW